MEKPFHLAFFRHASGSALRTEVPVTPKGRGKTRFPRASPPLLFCEKAVLFAPTVRWVQGFLGFSMRTGTKETRSPRT